MNTNSARLIDQNATPEIPQSNGPGQKYSTALILALKTIPQLDKKVLAAYQEFAKVMQMTSVDKNKILALKGVLGNAVDHLRIHGDEFELEPILNNKFNRLVHLAQKMKATKSRNSIKSVSPSDLETDFMDIQNIFAQIVPDLPIIVSQDTKLIVSKQDTNVLDIYKDVFDAHQKLSKVIKGKNQTTKGFSKLKVAIYQATGALKAKGDRFGVLKLFNEIFNYMNGLSGYDARVINFIKERAVIIDQILISYYK